MIKIRMKKLGAFAIAAMMAMTVASTMPVTTFAVEDNTNVSSTEEATPEKEASEAVEENVVEQEAPDEALQEEEFEEETIQKEQNETVGAVEQATTVKAFGKVSNKTVNKTVTSLALGQEYTGSLAAGGEKEFSFTTSNRDSYYDIRIVNMSVNNWLYGSLYDNMKVQIYRNYGIRQNESDTYRYLFSGEKLKQNTKYYIKVESPYSTKTGKYAIIIKEIYDDMGNSYDNAKVVSTGILNGKLEIEGNSEDQDWMKFTVPSTGKYRVKLTNRKSTGYIEYQFYDKYAAKMGSAYGAYYVYQNDSKSSDYSFKKGQTYYIAITGFRVSDYTFSIQKLKKANTMTVKVMKKNVKKSKLKKKARKVKVVSVKNAKGALTYKKTGGSKKLSVNKKTGVVTVKKGTKKGKYTVKIKVRAAGTNTYKAKAKTVKVIVTVK